MKTRMAFMGFRHGHIFSLLKLAQGRKDVEVVAACEEDAETRTALLRDKSAPITHDNYLRMLDETPCDVVAVGDYYGRRGSIMIEALRRGKHVVGDKPICTSLKEIDTIKKLAAEKNLSVGCQFDLRDLPKSIAFRNIVLEGRLGEIHAISFNGQHPLNYGKRPAWYFEPGCHGGTINDIGIHAIDLIPWATGRRFARIDAARGWNARLKQVPHFQDGGQVMMTLDNGCGVLGDVSYFVPDSFSYSLPPYWRFTVWGSEAVVEFGINTPDFLIYRNGADKPETVPVPAGTPGGYFDSFLREVRGERDGLPLRTADVLRSGRITLMAQDAADRNLTRVDVSGV